MRGAPAGTPGKDAEIARLKTVSATFESAAQIGIESAEALLLQRDKLTAELEEARAELKVRTFYPGFPSIPEKFRSARSAFDSGYESGWRGTGGCNPYTSIRHRVAYSAGYAAGHAESKAEIDAARFRLAEARSPQSVAGDKGAPPSVQPCPGL